MSVILMTPNYMTSWYHKSSGHVDLSHLDLHNASVSPGGAEVSLSLAYMTFYGEAGCLVGLLTVGLMAVLAVTSVPSVSESLNWAEWVCDIIAFLCSLFVETLS